MTGIQRRQQLLDVAREVLAPAIRDLIERGHLARILISHDICYRSRLVRWGGHGYGHIFANVIPLMRRRGFSEAEVHAILVDNPRRLLTLAAGPA